MGLHSIPPCYHPTIKYHSSTTVATVTDVHSQLCRDRVKKGRLGTAAGLGGSEARISGPMHTTRRVSVPCRPPEGALMTLFVKTTGQLAPLCAARNIGQLKRAEKAAAEIFRPSCMTTSSSSPAAMPFLTKDVFQITPKSTVSVDSLNWSSLFTELLLCILLLLLLLLLAAAFT